MKKIVLTAAAVLVTGSVAMAAQVSIVGSKHDLSTTDAANANKEICVYCHTPHNAKIAVPLWNRNNPSGSLFQLYNSSTLSSGAQKAHVQKFQADSISLFCMSCHDGVVGLGDIINNKGAAGGQAAMQPKPEMLGRDLRTTHPVGFNFEEAQGEDKGLYDSATILGTFKTKGEADGKTTAQAFLYGSNGQMFECASCHRVHDPGKGNFLRIENTNSDLCLACHKK